MDFLYRLCLKAVAGSFGENKTTCFQDSRLVALYLTFVGIMLNEIAGETRKTFKTYLLWILNAFISVLALVLWAIFQYGMNRVIADLELSGIDAYVFFVLQIFSAISTLMPIAFYIYEDTRRMWRRTVKAGATTSMGVNGGSES